MLKILGYADRISVQPGQHITFHVSAEDNQPYTATLVRVLCGDCNPEGPGLHYEEINSPVNGHYEGQRQHTDAGSYMQARVPQLDSQKPFSFYCMIWPTLLTKDNQTLLHIGTDKSQHQEEAYRLHLRKPGILTLDIVTDGVTHTVNLPDTPLLQRQWYCVGFTCDPATGSVTLSQTPTRQFAQIRDTGSITTRLAHLPKHLSDVITLAGAPDGDRVELHYDGKIDNPALLYDVQSASTYRTLLHQQTQHQEQQSRMAHWDFSAGITGITTHDLSSNANHGTLFNGPTRGMKGWNWTGEHHRWTDHRWHYGAVHFHHDDLYDAGWEPAFTLQVPDDLKSDAYALRISSGKNTREATREYYIPFFVRPRTRQPGTRGSRDRIAFLAPTASYIAYANHGEHITAREAERTIGRLLEFGHIDDYLYKHPEIGGSVYDRHLDGSGVVYSSRLRPILNFTTQYHSWLGGHGSSVWQYNADTHLLTWLNHNKFDYDVITDEDLHTEGKPLLDDYRVVISGTHPEYYSGQMWTGLKNWIDDGGRFMYLGANGFYWHVAFSEAMPGMMEIRKAEDGVRTCEPEPGEYYHAFTGELSGLYRRRGYAPNVMCGVGFIAQGFDVCSYYRRAPDADNPRAAFIFEGVDDTIIGDFGLVGGGAAGLELDCINLELGSPPNILRLASSENHSQQVTLVNEEFGVVPMNIGGDQNDRIHADLSFYETPSGGAVFSTGSIAWCGSLLWNASNNNVSKVTENVLRRFSDPRPFDV